MPVNPVASDELVEWMVEGALPGANAREIDGGICLRLNQAGVPIGRLLNDDPYRACKTRLVGRRV